MALRKFDCLNCHHQFEADDQKEVRCPHCQSDNVEPARFRIPGGVWKWGGLAALAAVAVIVLLSIDWRGGEAQAEPAVTEAANSTDLASDSLVIQYVEEETGLKEPPKLICSKPSYDGKSYSCSVSVQNAPGSSYRIVLLAHRGTTVIARGDNGQFKDVPPSDAEGGQYDMALYDGTKDSLLCDPTPVTGFLPQKSVARKMTMEELQTLIDKGDDSLIGDGENDYIAPGCKLHCPDLKTGSILYDVIEKVQLGVWTSAKVRGVRYDEKNRIAEIEIQAVK